MIDLARFLPLRNSAFIGLDIGRQAVRMIELSRNKAGALVVEGYGSERLADGAVSDDGIEDLEHVMNAAYRLRERSGFKPRRAAIGIPPGAVTVRTMLADPMQPESRLEVLAKKHIAPSLDYHVADACIDFCIAGPSSPPAGQVEVLIAATRRESVEDRLAVAEFIKLQVTVADVENYAAHAATAMDLFTGTTLAADIDAEPLRSEASAYLVAYGLALRGFD